MQPVYFYGTGRPKVAVVAGPTASGKTELAVTLAQYFGGEVVSADSMQIYREMQIGTAKPTPDEMCGVPHHLIDFVPPDQDYSVAAYAQDADRVIGEILSRGRLPIICGGTGQYLHALLHHLQFAPEQINPQLRTQLQKRLEHEGPDALYETLCQKDPEAAAAIHPNNTVRVIRALELALSGSTKTRNNLQSRAAPKYDFGMVALNYADRTVLYDRIDRRVDRMLADGLVQEARRLRDRYGTTARAAIGYKELEPYFEMDVPLEDCAQRIKTVTRNYAKRQLTWLRSFGGVSWIYVDRCDAADTAKILLEKALRIV